MFYKNFFDESVSAKPGTLPNLKSVFTHRQVLTAKAYFGFCVCFVHCVYYKATHDASHYYASYDLSNCRPIWFIVTAYNDLKS